jgi:hypothetical protein
MGKIHCNTLKNKSDFQMLEKYLNNINTPLDKRIHEEYYSLKNKKTNETEVSQIPINKRMHRFIEWYKMASPGSNLEYNRTLSDRISRTPVKTNSSPINSIIFDEMSKTFERKTDFKCRRNIINSIDFDSNVQSLSINSNISTNRVEMNLRHVYLIHQGNFCKKVSKGPPECFRLIAWIICSQIPEERNEDLFTYHLKESIEEKIDNQIKKDLNRTLSEIYDLNLEDTQNSLYRLLRAFSRIDKIVAYCQGMNFIAGFLLLISDCNEVDCFYMMINLFSMTFTDSFGIRGFFTEDFPLLKAYLYVFDVYFQKKFPTLHQHFKDLEIPDEVWISKWFQTLYTICLPLNILIRLWDCLFSTGLDYIISFSLALIQQFEKDLLRLEDAFDINNYFKQMGPFFTTRNNKLQLNIEEIIQNAKRYSITKAHLNDLLLEYEKIHSVNISALNIKYDLNLLKHSTFKPDEYTVNDSMRKQSAISYGGENVILVTEEDDRIDCEEYIVDEINDKLNTHKLKVKLTPIKTVEEQGDL